MALEKFHYTFKDGKKITARRFAEMPFKVFREIQRTEDDEARGTIMMDALIEGCDAKSRKVLDEQPFLEVVNDLLEAWANADNPTTGEASPEE